MRLCRVYAQWQVRQAGLGCSRLGPMHHTPRDGASVSAGTKQWFNNARGRQAGDGSRQQQSRTPRQAHPKDTGKVTCGGAAHPEAPPGAARSGGLFGGLAPEVCSVCTSPPLWRVVHGKGVVRTQHKSPLNPHVYVCLCRARVCVRVCVCCCFSLPGFLYFMFGLSE